MPAKAGIHYEGRPSTVPPVSYHWMPAFAGMTSWGWLGYKSMWSPQRKLRSFGASPMQPVVYMLCKHRHGALYTGVTSDLARRVWEHRTGAIAGFTKRYGLKVLVWYEPHGTMEAAITREKHIKAWQRDWKISLIERMNPTWRDRYEDLNC